MRRQGRTRTSALRFDTAAPTQFEHECPTSPQLGQLSRHIAAFTCPNPVGVVAVPTGTGMPLWRPRRWLTRPCDYYGMGEVEALAKNMVWIPGGEFLMGAEQFYPEERPVRTASVDGFWIDEHPVTNAEFRRFVKATGHVTWAEIAPEAADYPDADAELLVPGSLVFQRTDGPVDLSDFRNWWEWVPGAQWRHPEGPGSTLHGRELHPVTHIAHRDAVSYAEWAGKQLPTEAEWERAARGGLEGKIFTWGDEFAPKGKMQANTWQGEFPWQNELLDGYEGTSPVRKFPPNAYGLYDMAGNVWEWTADEFTNGHSEALSPCCAPGSGREEPGENYPRRVTKGGSHLCAPNYCLRYRPAARQGETVDTTTGHIGFRCVIRSP